MGGRRGGGLARDRKPEATPKVKPPGSAKIRKTHVVNPRKIALYGGGRGGRGVEPSHYTWSRLPLFPAIRRAHRAVSSTHRRSPLTSNCKPFFFQPLAVSPSNSTVRPSNNTAPQHTLPACLPFASRRSPPSHWLVCAGWTRRRNPVSNQILRIHSLVLSRSPLMHALHELLSKCLGFATNRVLSPARCLALAVQHSLTRHSQLIRPVSESSSHFLASATYRQAATTLCPTNLVLLVRLIAKLPSRPATAALHLCWCVSCIWLQGTDH